MCHSTKKAILGVGKLAPYLILKPEVEELKFAYRQAFTQVFKKFEFELLTSLAKIYF